MLQPSPQLLRPLLNLENGLLFLGCQEGIPNACMLMDNQLFNNRLSARYIQLFRGYSILLLEMSILKTQPWVLER